MPLVRPVHPDPKDFASVDAYVNDMDNWWSFVMQEELMVLADRLPLLQVAWRNRWFTEHCPARKANG